MKKKSLLILVSSILVLSSCSGIKDILANSFIFDLLPESWKKEDKTDNEQEHEDHQEDQHDEEHQDDNTDNKDDLLQEYTATIPLSGDQFHDVASAAGVQINDAEYSSNVSKLKEYCDSFLEYLNLITVLNCTKLNTAEWDNTVYLCVGTGYYLNDKFAQGILKWTSGEKICKVEIKAEAYAKENPYSGDVIDYPAHVWIDSDDHSLEVSEGSRPEIKTFTKEYKDGVNSFQIKSSGGRVLLKEISITWRG